MEKKTNIKYISKIVWLALVLSLAAALVTAHLYREKSAEHVEAAHHRIRRPALPPL